MNILLLCGGPGVEHDVSIMSARNIIQSIDHKIYNIEIVYITKDGLRYKISQHQLLEKDFSSCENFIVNFSDPMYRGLGKKIDALFSIIHGTWGEDGVIQSFAKMINAPIVGCDILSSAICMDKDITKRLLRDATIPIVPFITITKNSIPCFEDVEKMFGTPFFIKPAQSGSSVGVSKVSSYGDYEESINNAFLYDKKVLIEKNIKGVEIECSILDSQDIIVSLPGKIINHTEFYSYHAKYFDKKSASFELPAQIKSSLSNLIQDLAVKTFGVLGCSGMARIDFFLSDEGELFVNEVNTIPGFTDISMYPKLLQLMGLSYSEIIDKLISSAVK